MSRKTIITLIVAAILIELWFVLGEVENGSMLDEAEIIYRQVWPFLRWLLLLIVLPAILIRLLAKADVICIRRLDIRNFTNLTREPVLNEQNAVRLLYKAMAPTPGNGRFGRTISSGFAESKRPSITISTGVATISLSAVLGYFMVPGRFFPMFLQARFSCRLWVFLGYELPIYTSKVKLFKPFFVR